MFLGTSRIFWKCKRQTTVSKYSAEVESWFFFCTQRSNLDLTSSLLIWHPCWSYSTLCWQYKCHSNYNRFCFSLANQIPRGWRSLHSSASLLCNHTSSSCLPNISWLFFFIKALKSCLNFTTKLMLCKVYISSRGSVGMGTFNHLSEVD